MSDEQEREPLIDRLRSQRNSANERLRLAREALLKDGYFSPDEVDDDIAPRIIERLAAMRNAPRRMIVLVITWKELNEVHSQAFGPWTANEDGSHLAKIVEFLNEWTADHGTWIGATTYTVTPVLEAS